MENYRMNRPGCRPYQHTCGMNRSYSAPFRDRAAAPSRYSCSKEDCSCHMPGVVSKDREMFEHLSHLRIGMGYVPCQKFSDTFQPEHALQVGTIFPDLCMPFCGKRRCSQ